MSVLCLDFVREADINARFPKLLKTILGCSERGNPGQRTGRANARAIGSSGDIPVGNTMMLHLPALLPRGR
jgi:hypothetical protein